MSGWLTTIVLTLDEEEHLPGCLASLAPLQCDVVVLDSGSRDNTLAIARAAGARVEYRAFTGYADQRNAALELPGLGEWVLFIDADERLTSAGATEILAALAAASEDLAVLRIPRRNVFFGREVRGGGWWPDYQARLLRRGRAWFDPARQVHEVVLPDGDVRDLRAPLIHLNYASWPEFAAKQRAYTGFVVRQRRAEGSIPRRRGYLSAPLREFYRRFVVLAGYRDGMLGARLALALAREEFVVVRRLRRRAEGVE